MRVVVLGTGIVGHAAVWDLVRRGYDVVAADTFSAAAEAVAQSTGAEAATVDAADREAVVELFAGAGIVVSAVPYLFGPALATAAIEAGSHYFDFGGNPAVVATQRTLHEAAQAAGVAVVPDCGLAPGVANALAADLIAQLGGDAVDEVRLRVGALPQTPHGPLGYQLAFSPLGLINEYDAPCEVIRDGRLILQEPLTEVETVEWERWGPLEAFHTAGGASSLAQRFAGRIENLDYKTIRYPGHCVQIAALRALGLFDDAPRTAEPEGVVPRRLMAALMVERLPRDAPDLVLLRVAARRGERWLQYQFEDVADHQFSALARTTAFPATALAHLVAVGAVAATGVHTMDEVTPTTRLLAELAPLGVDVAFSDSTT
jgi:lysine 6-dehydrogenase